MKFYFCETCGKRLTDEEISQGLGRDKKLKGVYCSKCAVGVLTMETAPMSNDEARKLLGKPPTTATVRKAKTSQARVIPAERHTARSTRTEAPNQVNTKVLVVIGLVTLVLGVALAAVAQSNSKKQNGAEAAPNAVAASRQEEGKTAVPSAMPVTQVAAKTPVASDPVQSKPEPETQAPPSEERVAQDAFERLVRFEDLAPDDTAGRIAKLESFAAQYAETITAARARTMLANFKKKLAGPETTTAKAAQPVSAPAPAEPPAANAGPVLDPDPALGTNYALASNGATIAGAYEPSGAIDGITDSVRPARGWTKVSLKSPEPILIVLKEPVTLNTVRILTYERSNSFSRYKIEGCAERSVAEDKWFVIADKTGEKDECRGWQEFNFAPQTVQCIRVKSTYNSVKAEVHYIEIQAFNRKSTDEKKP